MVIMVGSRQKKKKKKTNRKESGSGLKEVGLEAQGLLLKALSSKIRLAEFPQSFQTFSSVFSSLVTGICVNLCTTALRKCVFLTLLSPSGHLGCRVHEGSLQSCFPVFSSSFSLLS